jgi:hypothetical protein
MNIYYKLRIHISIKNDLIPASVVKKLLCWQNQVHFVGFGMDRLQRHDSREIWFNQKT